MRGLPESVDLAPEETASEEERQPAVEGSEGRCMRRLAGVEKVVAVGGDLHILPCTAVKGGLHIRQYFHRKARSARIKRALRVRERSPPIRAQTHKAASILRVPWGSGVSSQYGLIL